MRLKDDIPGSMSLFVKMTGNFLLKKPMMLSNGLNLKSLIKERLTPTIDFAEYGVKTYLFMLPHLLC